MFAFKFLFAVFVLFILAFLDNCPAALAKQFSCGKSIEEVVLTNL